MTNNKTKIDQSAPRILTPKKTRYIVLACIFGPLALLGLLLVIGELWYGWLFFAVFGIAMVACILSTIPAMVHLRLDAGGFAMRSMGKRKRWRWDEVEPFFADYLDRSEVVAFNYADRENRGLIVHAAGKIRGYDEFLPESYGMSVKELVDLLNQWRDAARRQA